MTEKLTLLQENNHWALPATPANWQLIREKGYSPVQLLVSAVAACGGYVYQSVLENSHVPFELEKIEVSYTRDEKRQSEPVKSIQVDFFAKIPEEFQAKAIRCLRLVAPNCPVMQSIDPAIQVEETVTFL